MSQIWKIIIIIIITTTVVGGGIYYYQNNYSTVTNQYIQITKYNCEQSGGEFILGLCTCPSEFGADMYDKITGYCETTHGGPGGELGEMMTQTIGLRLQLDECKKNIE